MGTIKKLFIFAILMLFYNCSEEQLVIIPENSLNFQFLNFTDLSYQNATLYIGAKDGNNNFIATDSIKYTYIPSNLSPNGQYTYLDNCTLSCGNDGFIDGYHYFFQDGKQFVEIPFSPDNNQWKPDLSKVLEINDEFSFELRLANGTVGEISGFDIRRTLIDNPYPVTSLVKMYLTPSGIEGKTSF